MKLVAGIISSAVMAAAVLVVGCASAPSATPGASGANGSVNVTLTDSSIQAAPATIAHGAVTFAITNSGSAVHELEVLTLPDTADPANLPVSNSVVDQTAAGVAKVDEAESIAPLSQPKLSANLAPGRYLLLDNLPGNYQHGMYAVITVQ